MNYPKFHTWSIIVSVLLLISLPACKPGTPKMMIVAPSSLALNQLKDSTGIIKILNPGSEDLVIEKHRSSCRCTVVNLKDSTVIKPGDSLMVTMKFKLNPNEDSTNTTIMFRSNAVPAIQQMNLTVYRKGI